MKNKSTDVVTTLTLDSAQVLLALVVKIARQKNIAISASVTTPWLIELAYVHELSATPHSAETSRRKAVTAASTKKSTGWMNESLEITLPLGTGNMLTNIPGGMPIFQKGILVGAVGVAGGTVEQDAEIAKLAVEEFEKTL